MKEKHVVTVFSFNEEGYSKALLATQELPPVLFVRGKIRPPGFTGRGGHQEPGTDQLQEAGRVAVRGGAG